MVKRLLLLCLCCCTIFSATAQNHLSTLERIKEDSSILYGEGRGRTDEEADKYALANLISQISVSVAADFSLQLSDLKENGQNHSSSSLESVINTYSAHILPHAKCLFVAHEPSAHVVRYIKESELEQVFKAREERAREWTNDAQRMLAQGKVEDALRYYYWALSLVKSLPHPTAVKYKERQLINWIPQQMDEIFRNLKVAVAQKRGNVVDVLVTYKGQAVNSLDFQYFDGAGYVPCDADGGRSQLELRVGYDPDAIKIKYEYEYPGQDREVEMVMKAFAGTTFPKASTSAKIGDKKLMRDASAQLRRQVQDCSKAVSTLKLEGAKRYMKVMDAVQKAVRTKSYASVREHFTYEGFDMFEKLMNYGKATVLGEPQYSFYQMNNRVVCRSIPMKFNFRNNNRSFQEDVTFTFNADMKIESIAFGLDQTARRDIFTKETWPDSVRMVIATFLENYKTAFALKRLDYIENIFADNAVIIVGHVVKPMTRNLENSKYLNNEYVRYSRQDKQQYLKNLRRCFNSNEFINIRFTDNDILKLGKGHGESYGILIHQDYYSSSYSDSGYLCLLVDFNEADEPKIVLRTWQPQRDPSLTPHLPRDHEYWGIFSPYSF